MNKLVIVWLLIFCSLGAWSQTKTPLLEKKISVQIKNQSSQNLLQHISGQTGIIFSYNPDILKDITAININVKNKTVRSVLRQSLGESIKYRERGKYVILQKEKPSTKNRIIEGYVSEPLTGKNIGQATVYDKNTYASVLTNQYGYFKLEVPESDSVQDVLTVSKDGRSDTVLVVSSKQNQFVEAEFNPVPKDTMFENTSKPNEETLQNQLIPQWMVSKAVFVNTFNLSDTFFRQINFSVLPYVSTNRLLTGNSVNNIALNLTVGYCQEIRVAEFGLILNIVRDNVRHVQVAGVGNIVGGKVWGYQGAGVFNIAQSVFGIQHAWGLNLCQEVKGAQIASVYNRVFNISGLQVTGIYNKASYVDGVQISSILNKTDSIHGIQLSGIVNTANTINGGQVAGYVNVANRVDSIQLAGFLNLARGNSGLQVAGFMNRCKASNRTQVSSFLNLAKVSENIQVTGFLNIAGKVDGLQIGTINVSDTCEGVPMGVMSVVRKGLHSLEISTDESLMAMLGFRTGVNRFYNIISAGIRPFDSNYNAWSYAYGLGTAHQINDKSALSFEFSWQDVVSGSSYNDKLEMIKLSATYQYSLTHTMSVSAALSFNSVFFNKASVLQSELVQSLTPYRFHLASEGSQTQIDSWLGLKIGLRFF